MLFIVLMFYVQHFGQCLLFLKELINKTGLASLSLLIKRHPHSMILPHSCFIVVGWQGSATQYFACRLKSSVLVSSDQSTSFHVWLHGSWKTGPLMAFLSTIVATLQQSLRPPQKQWPFMKDKQSKTKREDDT
ncbi:hypothetical protein AMECASPLE_010412 [Ameca splendens]|uniref:Uncharacterized protein n=1 Tax=Ameca splendens TaxID=208324 RepID=A0ABV0ZWP8_9TELE